MTGNILARCIVEDHEFPIALILAAHGFDCIAQQVEAIVRGDDDGKFH